MIDNLAGGKPAQRSAYPLHCSNRALGQIVATGAAHDVGDHQGRECAENPGANAIEQLDADQPEAVVGKGVERCTNGQDTKPGKKEWLSPPSIGLVAIGSMTACAATMQVDIIAVASYVMGAAAFGLRPLWVNRAKMPEEYAEYQPVREIADLAGLASLAA
jgi:hypothetical protein